jgi:hypothetical protein
LELEVIARFAINSPSCARLSSRAAMMVLGLALIASATVGVPEIDPTTATSGLALLAGGVLLLLERRRLRRR